MLVAVILAVVSGCVAEPLVKLQRTPLINKRPGSGNIDTITAQSVLDCARKCYGECRSLFYVRNTRECQTHNTLYTAASPGLIDTVSTVYYEKEAHNTTTAATSITTTPATSNPAIPTTKIPATSTTIPPVTSTSTPTASSCTSLPVCPALTETNYIQHVGCNETFSYRLYTDIQRTFTNAKTQCASDGGHLFEILTIEKMNFARNLVKCADYSTDYFWIDGEYNGATERYETSNGDPLPMTQGTFFGIGKPDSYAVGQCVWFDHNIDHLLDDALCGLSRYVICEKP